jgi:hypothetical protein
MPKTIFEFKTEEERDRFMACYYDGGGEDGIYEAYTCDGDEWPEIKITKEE